MSATVPSRACLPHQHHLDLIEGPFVISHGRRAGDSSGSLGRVRNRKLDEGSQHRRVLSSRRELLGLRLGCGRGMAVARVRDGVMTRIGQLAMRAASSGLLRWLCCWLSSAPPSPPAGSCPEHTRG